MESGDTYKTEIQGNMTGGQAATGRFVHQTMTVVPAEVLGAEGLAELRKQIAEVRTAVVKAAPADEKAKASEVVDRLEETLTTGPPDPSRLASAKSWIADHAPAAIGAVSSLIVHPLVGRLVEAAGDAVVAQFRALFGDE